MNIYFTLTIFNKYVNWSDNAKKEDGVLRRGIGCLIEIHVTRIPNQSLLSGMNLGCCPQSSGAMTNYIGVLANIMFKEPVNFTVLSFWDFR